eukprot:Em0004g57a
MFAKLRQKTIDEKPSPSAKAGSSSDGLQRRDSGVDVTVQAKTSPPAHNETPTVVGTMSTTIQLSSTTDARLQPEAGIDVQEDQADSSTASYRGPGGVGVDGEDLSPSDKESPISKDTQSTTCLAGQEDMSVPRASSADPAALGEYPLSPPDLTSETPSLSVENGSSPALPAPTPALPAPTPALPAPTPALPAPTPALSAPTPASLASLDQTRENSSPSPQPLGDDGETKESCMFVAPQCHLRKQCHSPPGLGERDIETAASLEKVSHEELATMFVKQRLAAQRYKGRFSEIMEVYKKLEKEKVDYIEREKRLNRKLLELKEVHELDRQAKVHMEETMRLSMEEKDEKINVLTTQVHELDRQAKVHMEETMRLSMEEKDEKINVLTTQIRLLKERQSGSEVAVRDDPGMQQLKQKLSEYETTLTKYRDGLRMAKEKILQLQKEKDSLVGELKAKAEKLEQKEVHSTADAVAAGGSAAGGSAAGGSAAGGSAAGGSAAGGSAAGGSAVEKGSSSIGAEPNLDQGHRAVELEKKLEESRSSCVQLERTLEESKTSYAQLEERFLEHSTTLNKSKVLIGELEEKLEESRSSCVQLEKSLQESRASYVQLEKRSEEEQNSIKAQYERVQLQLMEQNAALQKDVKHLKNQTQTYDRELKSARQSLEESRDGFNQRSRLTDETNHRLQGEVIRLREQVDSLRVDLEARDAAMRDDREKLTQEWESKMALSLTSKEDKHRGVLADQEMKHSTVLSDRDAKHRSELSSLEEELGKALREQQIETGNLTLALQVAHGEVTSLQDQVANGLSELQKCKAQIGVLEEERGRELERVRVTHEEDMSALREEHGRELRAGEERWQAALEEQGRLLEEEKLGRARELAALRDKMSDDLERKREEWAKAEAERREVVVALEAKVAGLASENRATLTRLDVARREGEAAVKSLQLEMDALAAGKEERLADVAASLRAQVDSLQDSQRQLQASYDESRKQEAQVWESRLAQVTHSYLEKEDQLTKRLRAEQEKSEGLEAQVCSIKKEMAQKMEELEVAHSSKLQELERGAEALKMTQAEELVGLQACLKQMDDLVRTHRDEVKRLAESHGVHLKEIEEAHAALLITQKREAESTLRTRLAEKENLLRDALASKEEQLCSVRGAFEEDLATLKETHASELASHQKQHRFELDELTSLHREASKCKERLEVEMVGVRDELARSQSELARSASCWASEKEALEERLRAQQTEMDILVANHGTSHDNVVAEHRQELENLRCQVVEAKQEAKLLQEQHEVAMSQLKAEHEKALQSRGEQHEVAMSQLKAEHEKALQSRGEQHESRGEQHEVAMSQLKAEHEKALQSRGEQHEVAMSQLKAEHEKALQSRGEQHEVAMSQLKAEHEGLLASQRQTVDTDVGKQVKEVEGQWKERARKLREELKKLMATNSELQAKLGGCEVRVKEGDIRSQALTVEVEKFKEMVGRLEASLKVKEEELVAAVASLKVKEEELVAAVASLKVKEEELVAAVASLKVKEEELVAAVAQHELLENQAEEKRLELKKKAESKIATLKKQLAAQLEQVASMEGGKEGYEQLKKENAQLREELHRTLDTQKEMAATGEKELCSMRQALERKEGEVKDLVVKAGNFSDRAQVAEKRSVELEQECSQLSQEFAILKATAESLQSENHKLSQELVEKVSIQETQSAERHALEDHVQNLRAEMSSLQAAMKLEKQSHHDLAGRLRREVEEAEQLCLTTEEEWKGRLDKVLVEVNLEREKLIQEHKRRTQEVLAQVQTLQEQLSVCQGDRDDARGQLESLRREGGQKITSDLEVQRSLEESKAKLEEVNTIAEARVALVVNQCQVELAAKDRLLEEQSARHKEELMTRERKMEQRLLEEQARYILASYS